MELIAGGFAVIVLIGLLRKRVSQRFVSPVYALVYVYLAVFVAGPFLYDPSYGGSGVRLSFATEKLLGTTGRVLWIVSAFMAGVLTASCFTRQSTALRRPKTAFKGVRVSRAEALAIILLGVAAAVTYVIGVGPQNMWLRHEYLLHDNRVLTFLGEMFSKGAGIALGVAAAQRVMTGCRSSAFVVFCVLMVLMAAKGTRGFALLPFLFSLGMTIAAPSNRRVRAALVLSLVAGPFLTLVPLAEREMPEQGLATLHRLPDQIGELDWRTEIPTLVNNVFISVPITHCSAQPLANNPDDYVRMALDPTPGMWTDWYVDQLRINVATPFNAIGDLLRAGLATAALYYFVLGLYFCRIELRLRSAEPTPGVLVLVAIAFAFTIMSLQYPLRSVTRLVYYMLVIDWCGCFLKVIRPRQTVRLLGKPPRILPS